MRLSIPANYDDESISALKKFPVTEVYGKLGSDPFGGGRPSYATPPVSRNHLARHAALLRESGIRFNYLLNSACQGNSEWGRSWQKRCRRFLDQLGGMGITTVTVATPYLLEMVKSHAPHFSVKVSIYAQVDTASRARFWEDLGADAITVESFSINRNVKRLRAIRKAVNCDLQLIPNHCCLPNCAMQPYHQVGFAHASDGGRGLFIDYCLFRCTQLRLETPSLFIRSAWIRPEDCAFYENLGYESFKLLERGMPTTALLHRVKAYAERCSPANLAELLIPYGFRETRAPGPLWFMRHFFRPLQVNPLRLGALRRMAERHGMRFPLNQLPVRIHSRLIPDDFVMRTTADTNCDEACCADGNYCDLLAEKAVEIDETWRSRALQELNSLCDSLSSGRLWNV